MDQPTERTKGRAEALFQELQSTREPFLKRARLCSKFTLPALIPDIGMSKGGELYRPHQSIGARLVNNLASKLLLSLLPPTRKFFRVVVDEQVEREIPDEERGDIELGLVRMEQSVQKRIDRLGVRAPSYEAMRHLIVGGNVAMFIGKDHVKTFPLNQYVCRRDGEGRLLEFVLEECVSPMDLPEEIRQFAIEQAKQAKEKTAKLYTHVYRDGGTWHVYQEVYGQEIPGSRGTYPKDANPWLVLRWTRIDGEDYGRGLCDDYIGDILAVETLTRSITRGSAAAAKVVFLVSPNGQTDPNELERAEEGEFVYGQEGDVTTLGLDKAADFRVAFETQADIIRRLSYAFLLNSAVQRDAERVTREEIQFMAQELEDALGGVYSVLAEEFQLPLVQIVMKAMQRDGTLKSVDGVAHPTIITGIDALGRSHELAKLDAFTAGLAEMFGPQALGMFIHPDEYLKRRAAGLDMDPKGLIKTPEERAQESQAAQQQGMIEKLGPNVIQAMSKMAQPPAAQAA